tara:strand:+ start:1034 stop:1168 length:135 start_codon:yes stop_codon:yes gene_type:complete
MANNKGKNKPTMMSRTVTGFSFLGILSNIGALKIRSRRPTWPRK